MFFMTLSNITMLVTYLLLGRYLGCLLVGGATLRTFIYYAYAKYNKKPELIFVVIFEIYFVLISLLLRNDNKDLFMLVNLCLLTYTTWQNNMTIFRIGYILSCILLITYDISVQAYVTSISEIIMLVFTITTLIKHLRINKITDFVNHFYNTIAPIYQIDIKKNDDRQYVFSSYIDDYYNNFCYLKSPGDVASNLTEIKKEFTYLKRKPAVLFQSIEDNNILEIEEFSKNHELLFHNCWMKYRTNYQSKVKKCQFEEQISCRPASEDDALDLLNIFKLAFLDSPIDETYKYSQAYYEKYQEILKNRNLKDLHIQPYIAYYKGQAIAELFIYTSQINAYICQISTLKEYRRKGVASGLISYAIQDQIKCGSENFYVVINKNTILENFFMKNNFEEICDSFCYDLNSIS